MRLLNTVTLIFCISSAFALKDIRESAETTTNEVDNNAVGSNEGSYGLRTYGRVAPYISNNGPVQSIPEDVEVGRSTPVPDLAPNGMPMPTTGCFGHLPGENHDHETINNNVDGSNVGQQLPQKPMVDPVPPHFNPQSQHGPHFNGPYSQQFYPRPHPFYPHHHFAPWRQHMPYSGPPFNPHGPQFNPYGPQFNPHGPQFNPHGPWAPWRRNMPFVNPQYYPQNPWAQWRYRMPFVGPPMAPQIFPQNGGNRPPVIIVKMLQPIILPIAKPYYPEGGERDPDAEDVDTQRNVNEKYVHAGGFHRFGSRRFGGGRPNQLERFVSMPMRQSEPHTFGPYKINDGNGENIHISVKLH